MKMESRKRSKEFFESSGRKSKTRKYSDSKKRRRESSSEESDDERDRREGHYRKRVEPRYKALKRNTILDELQSILHDYPDNEQIIKELLQNAEDAGASVIKIAYHPGGDVSHIKSPYKEYLTGPALCFYNDSRFSDEDWEGITMVRKSIKQTNALKVGKFGIGFKSVFHMTDYCCVISGDRILFIDPLHAEENPDEVCRMNSIREYCHQDICGKRGLAPLHGVFGINEQTTRSTGQYEGSLFWFALRKKASKLSKNIYSKTKVDDILRSFQEDLELELLFLKNIEKIELYDYDKRGKDFKINMKVEIETSSLEKVRYEREKYISKLNIIEENLKSGNILKKETPICMNVTMFLTLTTQEKTYDEQWMICHYFHAGNMDKELVQLIHNPLTKNRPYVGIAARIDEPISVGKLFCFLPLPTGGESPTGLPVHVNGCFALDSNRQHIKWPSHDQSQSHGHLEDDMLWNKNLIQEVLPVVYVKFLETFRTYCQSKENAQQLLKLFYHYIPTKNSTNREWKCIVDYIDSFLIDTEVPSVEERTWVLTKDATFSIFENTSIGCKDAVFKLYKKCLKDKFIDLGKYEEVFNDLVVKDKSIKSTSPYATRELIKAYEEYKQFPAPSKTQFLIYCCSDGDLSDLYDLALFETYDGCYRALDDPKRDLKRYLFLCEQDEPLFLCGKENQLVKMKSQKLSCILRTIAKTGKYNLKTLDCNTCVKILEEVSIMKQSNETIEKWVKNVWKYLGNNFKTSLETVKHLHIVPTKGSTTPLRKISDCLVNIIGIDNEDLWTEIFALFNIFVVKDNLVQHSLMQPGNRYVRSALKDRLDVLEKQMQIPGAIEIFNCKSSSKSKETLKKYFADNNGKLISSLLKYIQELKIFRRHSSVDKFDGYTSIEDCRIIFMADKDFPVPFTQKMIVTFSRRESELVSKLPCVTEDLSSLVLKALVKLTREPSWLPMDLQRQLCRYILKKKQNIKNWKSIISHMKSIKWIRNRSGGKTACENVYDPTDKSLEILFDNQKFPCDEDVELVHQIGHLTRKDPCFQRDIETACEKIHEMQKKRKEREFITYSKALLEIMKDNHEMVSHISSYKVWPYEKKRVQSYPESLSWFQTVGLVQLDLLQPRKSANLIGSVMPVATEECDILVNSTKHSSSIDSKVWDHFQNVVKCYANHEYFEYMTVMDSIYQYFEQRGCLDVAGVNEFILTEYGFKDASSIYIERERRKDIDAAPYLLPLPMELHKFKTFFGKCRCYPSQTPQSLLEVLRKLEVKYKEEFHVDEVKKDLDLIVKILNCLSTRKQITVEKPLNIPVRSQYSRRIIFKPANDCVYADTDWFSSKFTEDENFNFVHPEIHKDVARELGVRSLKEYTLADAEEMFEEFGQSEKLTLRLKSLLEGYKDGLSVPKELIQNADDAGAKVVKFLYDERENKKARSSLIDPNMKSLQGPALWAYNDAEFTDEDFKNIQKLSAATKKEDSTKIGRFGVGFNAVYNLTDVPSFVSGGSLVYLDPHEAYLGEALRRERRSPGIKLQLKNKIMMEKMRDQFLPYENVFGFQASTFLQGGTYHGTLFRLPLRTGLQAMKSDICQKEYSAKEMDKLIGLIYKAAGNLLLFTQNVQELHFYRLQNTSRSPEKHMKRILIVKKSMQVPRERTILQHFTEQLQHTNLPYQCIQHLEVTVQCPTSDLQSVQWLLSWSVGVGESLGLWRNKESDGAIPLTCVAVPRAGKDTNSVGKDLSRLPEGFYRVGNLFCFLPLPIETGLPFHINGNFSISTDRQHIIVPSSDEKEDSKHVVWNKCLIRDSVLNALIALLLHLCQRVHANQLYTYYSLWPLHVNGIWKILQKEFYKKITEDASLQIFFTSNGWKAFHQCKFLHPKLQKDRHLKEIALAMISDFGGKSSFICDLPRELFENIQTFCTQKQIVTRQIFACEYFLRNIERIEHQNYDYALKFILSWEDDSIKKSLEETLCIPTQPNGKKKCPKDLVDPDEAVAKLFSEIDEVFPENSYLERKTRKSLVKLGMMTDTVSKNTLLEQGKGVQNLLRKCQQCAYDRVEHILRFCTSLKLSETDIKSWHSIAFLPAKPKPNDWQYSWYLNKLCKDQHDKKLCRIHKFCKMSLTMFFYPSDLYFSREQNYVASNHFILGLPIRQQEEHYNLLKSFGVKGFKQVTLDMLSSQLLDIVQHEYLQENAIGICRELYCAFDRKLEERCDITDAVLANLSKERCIFVGERFVHPHRVVFSMKYYCEPFLFHLKGRDLGRCKHFLKAVGVRKTFNDDELITVLKEVQKENRENRLSKNSLQAVCQVAMLLESIAGDCIPDQLRDQLFLPDHKGIMRKVCDLCQNDFDWIPESPNMTFLHPGITKSVAKFARIKSKREQDLLISSSEIGFDFGQSEDLKSRIKSLLKGYPEISILKELLQNADDAGSTELHFIMDFRQHKTDKLFSDSWAELQGPALCVYNDSVFTEKDIQGIQNLGMGSKTRDSTKTGRYGVGFNAVYRLTDVPCFLTRANDDVKMCVFDPHCKYISDATTQKPGRMFKDAFNYLKQRFPDVLSCFLTDERIWEKTKGTLFRFPLRRQDSEISTKCTPKNIKEMLEKFKAEMGENMLFLDNVRKITISRINRHGKMNAEFFVEATNSIENDIDPPTAKKQLAKRPLAFDRSLSYNRNLNYNGEFSEKWLIVQRYGFGCESNTLGQLSKDLGLLPVAGVAILRSQSSRDFSYKAFCTLPLPVETGIPMHMHGQFALQHDTRTNICWPDVDSYRDERHQWNECLIECVAVPLYAKALTILKDDICKHGNYEAYEMDCFHQMFPDIFRMKEIFHYLAMRFYKYTVSKNLEIFPVLQNTERNTICRWIAIQSDVYFEDLDEYFERLLPPENVTDRNFQKEAATFANMLRNIGMKLLNLPLWIHNSMEEANISIEKISPRSVLIFFQNFEHADSESDKYHLQIDVPIGETLLKSMKNVIKTLEFCLLDNSLKSEEFEGVPLLLTADGFLRKFSTRNIIYLTKLFNYTKIFPRSQHQLSHLGLKSIVMGHSGIFKPFIKYIQLDVLSTLLKENLPFEMQGCKIAVQEVRFPSQSWLQLFWCFAGKLYNEFICKDKGGIEDFVDEMKLHIKEWALVPVLSQNPLESKMLYPIQDGKTVFNLIHEDQSDVDIDGCRVTQAMKRMCLPYLDMSEIAYLTRKEHLKKNRRSSIEDGSFVLIYLVATADNALDILQCIVSNKDHLRNMSECDIVMEYFERNLFKLKIRQDTKRCFRILPFYENVSGDYQTLDGNVNTVVVLPSGVPVDGLYELGSVCGIKFLKHKNYSEVYRFAGCEIVDDVQIYRDYVLPHFIHLPEKDILIHIQKLKNDVQMTPEVTDLLKQTAFLVKNECRQRASQFYNPKIELFSLLCQENEILPEPFIDDKWIPFLILCGLKNEVTKEIFLEFALRIEEKERKCGVSKTVKRCSRILIKILKSEEMFSNCMQFMNDIKDIRFILPHRVDDKLRMIHSQFADNTLLKFADSELVKNEELVWTICGILHKTACSIVDDQDKWKMFGHDEKPPEGKVVQHIKLICSKLKKDQTAQCEENQELDRKLCSVLQTIYSYLETSSSDMIDLLRDTSFIYITERKVFATPDKVVISMEDNYEIPPYLYKAPTYFGQFHSVFQKFGSSEKLSSNHCADVLGAIFKETEGDITDPNERKNTIKAVHILFEKLKQEASEVQLKSQIYLPNREHKLMLSTNLVVVDDRVLEKRVNKGNPKMNYFIGFSELKMENVRDPVETICLIPVEYRPKLLSKIVTEEISMECKSKKSKSEKAKYLQTFLCCEEFVKAAIRLVRHERYKEDKTCGDEEENHFRDAFAKLRIFEVDNLTTVLKMNSEIIENTEMKRILSYVSDKENPDVLFIYLNSETRSDNTKKWIESIADELTRVINFILKNELNESCLHLAHILRFIENPASIQSYLDSKQIISVEDTCSNAMPFIPELGSEIPINLHHLLQNSFESLETNEFVGYEQFDPLVDEDTESQNSTPVFLFAQVEVDETKETKNVWDKRFRINIGSEHPVTVSATRIYKFVRLSQRSEQCLEIAIYSQSAYSDCSHSPKSERRRDLKEEKRVIKNIMKDSINKPLDEQKRIWKRLLLKYHPDKHMDSKEFYTKLTQYINSLIQRINEGGTLDYDSEDDVDGQSGRRPYRPYRPHRSPPSHGFNFSSFYEHCFNRGKSYAEYESAYTPPPEDQGYFREFRRRGAQPGQADRWYRQAKYDLAATQCCEGRDNAHNWTCFKCHQAVEKALKALLYQKDADLVIRTHNLVTLASRIGNSVLTSRIQKFEEITGSYEAMRYPDVTQGSVPSEIYTKDQASRAYTEAKAVLEFVKRELETLRRSP